ncbi:MAG: hypothetical protein CLLPBCKN_000161 [Chroococcidiopsis cubana SAG 39.79]|nr:hypothetical protein [Chroococcidiopsis cubana SAG 39.79]
MGLMPVKNQQLCRDTTRMDTIVSVQLPVAHCII